MSKETLSCKCGAMMVSSGGQWKCPHHAAGYFHDNPVQDKRVGLFVNPASNPTADYVDVVMFLLAQPKQGPVGKPGPFGSRAGRQTWKRSKHRRGTLAEWYDSQMPKRRRRIPQRRDSMLDEIVGWMERKAANAQWWQLKKMKER